MNIDAFIYLEKIRAIVSGFPGLTEKQCFGTPGFYAEKKFFARIKEDGETLALYNDDRNKWITENPGIFFITDHYLNYSMLLIRLPKVKDGELKMLLLQAWQMRASKRLLKAYNQNI